MVVMKLLFVGVRRSRMGLWKMLYAFGRGASERLGLQPTLVRLPQTGFPPKPDTTIAGP